MLVNTHKLYLVVILVIFGLNNSSAQIWSLQQCIDTAQQNNKRLQISQNNMAIGGQKVKEAKANLLPKITAAGDYKYYSNLPYQLMPLSTFNPMAPEGQFKEAQFGVPHNINLSLQFAMPLYNPQVYGGIEGTKIAAALTKLQYQKTEEQITYDITNIYYNAQLLHHQLEFIDSNLINAGRLYNNMQLLNTQLLVKGTDVSKVELQQAQLHNQKALINSKYQQVINALKYTMGVSIEKIIAIDPTIQLQDLREYTVDTTLDIQVAQTQNKLLQSERNTVNKSRYLPSLNLIGTYGTTGYGYDRKPNDFLKFYPIGFAGIQLSYPVFNGTVTQRKINQKKLEIQNSNIQISLLYEQNKMEIENVQMQRNVAKNSAETTSEQIKLAQSIYAQTILQQKLGTASITEVLLADNALREAQQTYLSSVIEYLKADLELKKVTGNISSPKTSLK